MKTHKLQIQNELQELATLRSEIQMFIEEKIDSKRKNRIILSIDEVISNIIEHGFPNGEKSSISIEISLDEKEITFVIEDSGIEFNPLEQKEVDVEEHLELGEDGGMGIYIARKIMQIEYKKRIGGGNRLTLKKNLLTEEI